MMLTRRVTLATPGPEEERVPDPLPPEASDPTAESDGARDERGVGTFLYRMALASVGALVLAQEELENRFRKLRGAGGPEESAAPPVEERAPEGAADGKPRRTLAEHIDQTVNRVLHSLHVPTRGDVEDLSRRVEELTRRVQSLRR